MKQQEKISWIDYIISNNPNGVMQVLNSYGYTGYLAPKDINELHEAVRLLIKEKGDEAVESLLKKHPDYEILKDIYIRNKNNDGKLNNNNELINKINGLNKNNKVKNILDWIIVGGIIYLILKRD